MVTRKFLSASVALATLATATPAFAYPVDYFYPENSTRRMVELRDQRALPANVPEKTRMATEDPGDGRIWLGRAYYRDNLRFFNRTGLGMVRDGDYRILETAGDSRRDGISIASPILSAPKNTTNAELFMYLGATPLPPALVTTGAPSESQVGEWGWLRPTRRTYIRANRDRDLLNEMQNGRQ